MKTRLLSILWLFALFALFAVAGAAAKQPNVVIFLADDQGWGDLSVHGNTNLSTPNIDSLARDGALLERFFVCPVCAPTRAEFLTGRFYARTGVRGVSTGQERLGVDEKTIADSFKAAGYATGAFGKWHNGTQHPYHPNARGFDEYYGTASGHWGHYFDPILERNNEIIRDKGYIADLFTDEAMKFIEKNKDGSFFCYVPFNTPHSPMQVPDEYWNRFAERPIKMRNRDPEQEDMPHLRAALAMCENIDWNVGRVLEKLDELNLTEDTIVIYFSDNGPNGWRWNGGMKGKKGSIDDGGVRVPFLIRWPGHIPEGLRVVQVAGAIDLLPTLTEMAGIERVGDKPLDGVSMASLIVGGPETDWRRPPIISQRMFGKKKAGGPSMSVRNDRYHLDGAGRLYDMRSDPGQDTDVASEHPKVVTKLKAAAAKYAKEIEPLISGPDDRPFPVGYSVTTPLPARDGVEHGGVERSARAPNCSYFTKWNTKEGSITWDIEVAEAGDYEAVLYYTCAEGDEGSTIELNFEGEAVTATIAEAHDPPLYGKESDRTDNRGSESYVKDFKPMTLGTLRLGKARGPLTLRALEIPGKGVADVRWVMLTRK